MQRTLNKLPSAGFGNQIVTIEVGKDKDQFPVHQNILIARSGFFKAAFEGEFREAKDKSIPLLDAPPLQFLRFIQWLYFRRLPKIINSVVCNFCIKDCKGSTSSNGTLNNNHRSDSAEPDIVNVFEASANPAAWPTSRLYLFADRYDVPALRQALVDKLWYCYQDHPGVISAGGVVLITDGMPTTSPLFRFIVDLWVDRYKYDENRVCTCPIEQALDNKLPIAFVLAVMRGMSRFTPRGTRGGQGMKTLCSYHEHSQDNQTIKACIEIGEQSRKRQ